ncbi:MAG TPA: hypothetical protein VGL99_17795 [Chloroflexota bacterium]|jgi:hypothetical protein
MDFFRTPRSAALTTLALVLIVLGLGGLMVGQAFASSFGPPWRGGAGWNRDAVPPEIAGLMDVPADQRFAHFRGVQLSLTDKDNKPVRVDVTPGTVSSVSDTSITVNGNDGASHTYGLDAKTVHNDNPIKQNDQVVVATLNGSSTATAVFPMNGHGFGPRGPWGR